MGRGFPKKELKLIDLTLRMFINPVLDLDRNTSSIIGNRSFGEDPQLVMSQLTDILTGLCVQVDAIADKVARL
jgi:beta-glucosidase-like glycosyl hydrolase